MGIKKSGAGIGYGKKSDFTKDLTASPGSSRYQLQTIFDKNRTSRKGFSMYESREVNVWLFRKFPIVDISPSIHWKCQDPPNMTIWNWAKGQITLWGGNCRWSTALCLLRLRTWTQVLVAMKIQRLYRLGGDTVFQSIKGREPRCLTLSRQKDFSSSVSFP